MSALSLSRQGRLLRELALRVDRRRPLTTRELADRTGLATSSALRLLRRLEAAGRVLSFTSIHGGRVTYEWRLR